MPFFGCIFTPTACLLEMRGLACLALIVRRLGEVSLQGIGSVSTECVLSPLFAQCPRQGLARCGRADGLVRSMNVCKGWPPWIHSLIYYLPERLFQVAWPSGLRQVSFKLRPAVCNWPTLGCASVSSFSSLLLITCVTKDRQKFLITKFFSKLQWLSGPTSSSASYSNNNLIRLLV